MPHLQFELNFTASAAEKRAFAGAVIRHFSEVMDTGTDHVAVTLRCFAAEDLTFGRAAPSGGRTAFVNADIRGGRTKAQKRRLALAYIDEIARTWGVAREAVYVVFTEHDGEHFQLSDRVLPSWQAGEDPLAEPGPARSRRRAPRAAERAVSPRKRRRTRPPPRRGR